MEEALDLSFDRLLMMMMMMMMMIYIYIAAYIKGVSFIVATAGYPAGCGFVCCKVAVFGSAIKETLYVRSLL